jgi:hypothetical protein
MIYGHGYRFDHHGRCLLLGFVLSDWNCFTERRDFRAEKEIHAQGHRPLQGRLLTIVPGKT